MVINTQWLYSLVIAAPYVWSKAFHDNFAIKILFFFSVQNFYFAKHLEEYILGRKYGKFSVLCNSEGFWPICENEMLKLLVMDPSKFSYSCCSDISGSENKTDIMAQWN